MGTCAARLTPQHVLQALIREQSMLNAEQAVEAARQAIQIRQDSLKQQGYKMDNGGEYVYVQTL